MKLVGATDSFVRGPFIIESVLYALFASAITILIILPMIGVVSPYIDTFFAGYDFNMTQYVNAHLFQIFGLQIVLAFALAVLSSVAAIGRYLRV